MQYRLGSGSWSANIPTATNADTYTVGYKVVGGNNYNDVAEQTVSVTIAGEDSRLTSRPTAKNLTYNGNKQELVNAGTATGGTLQYRVGETGEWLSSIPIARDAGTYTVYYKVKGDANHNDTLEDSLTVTIAKANSQITKVPEAKTNLVATGSEQELVSAGTVTGGTMQYRLGLTGEWTTEIPKAVAGGEYTVYYRVLENINYNGLNGGNITVRIDKSESEMTADKKVVTYDDTVSLTVNVQRKAISTFAADNQVEFYVLEGLQYLGGATVQYTDGVNGTATIMGIKINKSRFKIGENKIKVIYGGGVSLGASESEEIIVEVKPKEIGLTWENVLDRTYNGNPSNAAATATKLAEGDTVNVTVTGGDATNAGTHTATAAALTGPDAGYYKLPEANTQDYRILKAEPVIDLAPVGLTGLMCNDAAEERIDVTVANADSIVSTEYAVNVTYNDVLTLEATVSTAGNNGIQTYAAKEQVEFEANGFIIGSGSVTYDNESKTTGKVTVRNIQVNKTRFKPGRNVVTARYGGTVNINESNDNQIIVNVNPIELNITWSDYDTRVYNGLENNVSASISGVLEDDVVNVEVENGTAVHAGQYTATAKLVGADARYYKLPDDASTQPYEILKADIEITKVPEANTLTYTGQAQELVTAGEVSNGKIVYKVGENGEYSDMLPSVTDAGNYKVYYMADGGTNYKDSEEKMIDVSIAKADPTVQAPTAAETLVYNGVEQELIRAGSTNGGKMLYKLGRTGEYSESIPKAIDAANYTVYYMVEGDDNYNAAEEQSITVTMAKADSQVTADATDIQYQDTLELTVKVSLRNLDISTYALYDTVQFYIGEDMTPLRQANVEYTNEANTEGTARLSVKVNKTNNFVPGENIITVEYGGSVNINGSDDNTIIVNVTPMQLGIEWSNYETRPYDGEASNVTAVITGAAKTDKVELEVTGGNEINAGVHSATAALVGDDSEFYTLSDENSYQMYEITKIDPEYIIPTGVTAEYGQLLSGVRLPDGWSWEDGSQDVGEIGEHIFKAVYTPEDSENYNVISDVDIVVSVISGRDYTITDIANAEEDGFVDVSVIKNTQANGVLIVSSYSPEGILIGVRAVNINGITGEIPETDTVKVELRPQDGGYMSAYVWSSLVGMTPLSGKFSK